jgi:hypothetical protein
LDCVRTAAFGTSGEVDERQAGCDGLESCLATLGQGRILRSRIEEPVPVAASRLDVVEPMAYVGEHAVDVEDRHARGVLPHGI